MGLAQSPATITGEVTDSLGKPLPGTNVWIPDSPFGSSTDQAGHFQIEVPPGEYTVFFNRIGYRLETRTLPITAGEEVSLNITLDVEPVRMRGGIVVEEESQSPYLNTQYRATPYTAQNITSIAEPDVFTTITSLPGIIQTNDLTGNLYVRGGASDQNRILLDGVPIYNPYHLFGLFGSFNIWALESFNVYPAEFPVRYSGRLSSIIDIRTRDPWSGDVTIANLSLVSSGATVTRSWKDEAVLVSARRSYLDLMSQILGADLPYYFYDTNLKFVHKFTEALQLRAWGYFSQDRFRPGLNSLQDLLDKSPGSLVNRWGNQAGALQMEYNTSSQHSRVSLAVSRNYLEMYSEDAYSVDNSLRDIILRADVIQPYGKQVVHVGFYLTNKHLSYNWNGDYTLERVFYPDIPTVFQYNYREYLYGIYFQDEITITPKLLVSGGVIWDHWRSVEPFSPRLNIKWRRTEDSFFKLAAGVYHQNFSQGAETREGSVNAPVFPTQRASRALTISLGYSKKLNRYYSLNVEAYRRYFHDVPQIYRNAQFPEFEYGTGGAIGLDFYLKKGLGTFTYQLSGAVQQNTVEFSGNSFNPDWDVPFNINALFNWNITDDIALNSRILYHSGTPYTPVVEKYLRFQNPFHGGSEDSLTVIYKPGEQNSERLPGYFRMDLGLKKRGTWGPLEYQFNFQVMNLFNTQNILRYQWYDYYYNQTQSQDENGGTVTGLPLIPSFGIVLRY
ncbi:MAG: TonB-dependent receptor [Candidatus Marinimicrobia bacterium]|nr:TonB-dependent receptor [Candidatus Neomarinimicrobiota bacterium]MCF7827849.1 TonB-dependent receptor [Candidatus Neomarinimicrobiota bacterium]MCF7879396.1 TonB-dependent receptor [Candidatus Neomarinimicrobiota bacterium]